MIKGNVCLSRIRLSSSVYCIFTSVLVYILYALVKIEKDVLFHIVIFFVTKVQMSIFVKSRHLPFKYLQICFTFFLCICIQRHKYCFLKNMEISSQYIYIKVKSIFNIIPSNINTLVPSLNKFFMPAANKSLCLCGSQLRMFSLTWPLSWNFIPHNASLSELNKWKSGSREVEV